MKYINSFAKNRRQNVNKRERWREGVKLTLLFLIAFSLNMSANTYSEQTLLSLNIENKSIKDVLFQIESMSEFRFIYENEKINLDKKISIKTENQSIQSILKEVFEKENVDYEITENNFILINPKNKVIRIHSQNALQQQKRKITGVITDKEGFPLPGANVVEEGTTNGIITDLEGNFSLEVSDNAVLQISYIGYTTRKIAVNNQNSFAITLSEDLQALEEVVVVGYGTQRKSDLTGSMVVVNSENITDLPASSLQQALVGKVAGAFISPAQGADPSGGVAIRIRGTNSLNSAANNPLYVIDGIPMQGDVANVSLDPENVESISVLKDASATAIYGARAAAGVILVTTKSGKKGKGRFTFSSEFGVQTPAEYYDVINASEFYELFESGWDTWEYFTGGDRTTKGGYNDFYKPAVWDAANNRPVNDVEWQKAMLNERATWNKYAFAVSGGEENIDYYFNLSYEQREGIFMKTFFDRLSLNGKVNYQVSEKLKTGFSANIAYTERAGNGGLNQRFGSYMPTVYKPQILPLYHPGTTDFVYASTEWKVDPAYNIAPYRHVGFIADNTRYNYETQDNMTDNLGTTVNFYFDFKPIKELSLKTNVGIDMGSGQTKNIQYQRPAMHLDINNPGGIDDVATYVWFGKRQSLVVNEIINYKKTFDEKHNLDATAVFEAQHSYSDYLSVYARGSMDNDLDQISNQPQIDVFSPNGNLINPRNFGGEPTGRVRFASFMGRMAYNYDGRYHITGTLRSDGSSKFAEGYRWGTFGALALSWHVHKEKFFEGTTDVISQLKPRISYGTTGNQASVGDFLYIPNANTGSGIYGAVSYPSNLANSALTWETVQQFNAGVDISFLSNRVNLIADFYNKKSIDMLGNLPLPISSGYGSIKGNLGSIQNRGIDLALSTVNISKNNFNWTTDFTFSLNRNKILDLGVNPDGSKIDEVIVDRFIRKIGEPVSNYYLYSYDGVWQLGQEDEIKPAIAPTGHNQVGLFRVLDRQAEGEEGHGIINKDDRKMMGSPEADFYGGFTNNFTYKNWQLGIVCTYSVGNRLFNVPKTMLQAGHRFQQSDRDFYENHWSPENPTNEYQKLSTFVGNNTYQQNGGISQNVDHWLEDASYLRVANVSLNYNIPKNVCGLLHISALNLGINASNLITITGYSGLDPAADKGYSTGNPTIRGVDEGGYPPARTYMFSAKISF